MLAANHVFQVIQVEGDDILDLHCGLCVHDTVPLASVSVPGGPPSLASFPVSP
jgi:hypothetical protein